MDHEVILNEVLAWLDPGEAEEQSDTLFELIADWVADGEADPSSTILAYGVTPWDPDGFDSEAEYLASRRETHTMRPVTNRRSHLRWTQVPSPWAEAAERLARGGASQRMRRAEAVRAVLPRPDGWTPRALVTP